MRFIIGVAVAAIAVSLCGAASAQQNQTKQGDYYAPTQTQVQNPSQAKIQKDKEGDYYAPVQTQVQSPSTEQIQKDKEGDYYAPHKD